MCSLGGVRLCPTSGPLKKAILIKAFEDCPKVDMIITWTTEQDLEWDKAIITWKREERDQ